MAVESYDVECRDPRSQPEMGLEPTTSGFEVQRAIHCATRAGQNEWQALQHGLAGFIILCKQTNPGLGG